MTRTPPWRKNPCLSQQTANNMLQAPFASKVMSFLSGPKESVPVSHSKRAPKLSPSPSSCCSPINSDSKRIHYAYSGNQNPQKKLFFLNIKRSHSYPGLSFRLTHTLVLLKANYSTEMAVRVYIGRSIYLISLGNYKEVRNIWW